MSRSSRISGFYKLDVESRRRSLCENSGLEGSDLAALESGGLDRDTADSMIENVVGTYALPLGIALNIRVNECDYLVPMVIEEPSVVAATSNAAKMVRRSGGFTAEATDPVMIGQIELRKVPSPHAAAAELEAREDEIVAAARETVPSLCARGGGPIGIAVRILDSDVMAVHILIDCRDAMGANLVNSVAESMAPMLAEISGGQIGLRILSNLSVDRTVTVRASVTDEALGGPDVRAQVAAASRFAELDPFRAATHNKGIMNGVDAVLVACGQDWRSVEAGAHAYAALSGQYRPLATWRDDGSRLVGELTMPMALGTVGGALHLHRGARLSLALLATGSAGELATVIGAAGLAANLAALRALATDGIQRGHMSLHARVVARAAGARGDLIGRVAAEIAALGDVKPERAREILARLDAEPAAHSHTLEEIL